MTGMEQEGIKLSKISQSEKDKYHMLLLICGIKKQNQWKKRQTKKQTLNYREQTYGYQRGGEWGMGEIDVIVMNTE